MIGAELAAAALLEEGVEVVFGVPGTSEIPLVAAISDSSIEYMLCLHESVAIGMAEGFSRATSQRLAVANTHAAQGTLNGLGFIRAGLRDRIPVIVLIGIPGTGYSLNEPNHQLASLVDVLSRVTKWAWRVEKTAQIGQAIHRGVTLARTGIPGPAAVLIPQDFLEEETVERPIRQVWDRIRDDGPASAETITRIRELLETARSAVVMAGGPATTLKAVEALVTFSEVSHIPVIAESVDRGPMLQGMVFPTDHPNFLGFFSQRNRAIMETLEKSDLVILIGTRASYVRATGKWVSRARVLQIDPSASELGKNHDLELGVVGDITSTLLSVVDGWAPKAQRPPTKVVPVMCTPEPPWRLRTYRTEPLQPESVARIIASKLTGDEIVVDDSQSLGAYLKRHLRRARAEYLYGSLASHLGWGMPVALGVQVARPNERVISIISDGSFLLGSQGIWTAARYKLPVTFLLVNNGGFVSLRQEFEASGKTDVRNLTSLTLPGSEIDYVAIARGLGGTGMRVRTLEELESALDASMSASPPFLVDMRMSHVASDWAEGWFVPPRDTL